MTTQELLKALLQGIDSLRDLAHQVGARALSDIDCALAQPEQSNYTSCGRCKACLQRAVDALVRERDAIGAQMYDQAERDGNAIRRLRVQRDLARGRLARRTRERDEHKVEAERLTRLLEVVLPTPADLDWLSQAIQRESTDVEVWWKHHALEQGFREMATTIIGVWESGRVKTSRIQEALKKGAVVDGK